MSDLEEKIIEVLKRKQVLKMIVSEIAVDPELRYFLIQSIIPNVATKDDIRELRNEINNLRNEIYRNCLLYTSPSPRDLSTSRMPSSA